MPLSLILASLWVLAAAVVAMLPYRWQFAPGITLLILFVPLAVFVGLEVGLIWLAVLLFALGSMFRNPLFALARYANRRLKGEG